MTRPLLIITALLAALAFGYWLQDYIERAGFDRGYAAAQRTCHEAQLGELREVIDSTRDLTAAAHAASKELSQAVSARTAADAQTTRRIRDALATTAHLRVDCVFDDSVMRELTTAHQRAATAAAGGLGRAVPATDRTDE